jgi:hypothetical protein
VLDEGAVDRREAMTPRGGPDGGDGGKGGDLVLKISPHLNSLVDFKSNKKYIASNGGMGLERWETLLHLADFPGVQVDGCNVWVPDDIGYEVSFKVGFQCDKFRTAFTAGEWYLLGTRHN